MVKRAMNRAPGPADFWWEEHQATCGGRYAKVHEPPGFSEKKAKQMSKKGNFNQKCVRSSVYRQISLVVRVPGYRPRGPGFDSRHYQIS
jgi:hypothetical protein